MKYSLKDKNEAYAKLMKLLPEGTQVFTSLTHVSKSGMSRSIKVFIARDSEIEDITYYASRVLEQSIDQKNGGIKQSGAGMDMGYDIVHRLSYVLHGYPRDSNLPNRGYTLTHRWL